MECLDEVVRCALDVAEVYEVIAFWRPNRRISAGTSTFIVEIEPWQKVMPLFGLGARSMIRWSASVDGQDPTDSRDW